MGSKDKSRIGQGHGVIDKSRIGQGHGVIGQGHGVIYKSTRIGQRVIGQAKDRSRASVK